MGSIPGSGRSPGGGHGNPLQYSCLENSMDRGAWRATIHGWQRVGHDWSNLARMQVHFTYHTSQFKCSKQPQGLVAAELVGLGVHHLNAESFLVKVMNMTHTSARATSPPPWDFFTPYSPPEYPPQQASWLISPPFPLPLLPPQLLPLGRPLGIPDPLPRFCKVGRLSQALLTDPYFPKHKVPFCERQNCLPLLLYFCRDPSHFQSISSLRLESKNWVAGSPASSICLVSEFWRAVKVWPARENSPISRKGIQIYPAPEFRGQGLPVLFFSSKCQPQSQPLISKNSLRLHPGSFYIASFLKLRCNTHRSFIIIITEV